MVVNLIKEGFLEIGCFAEVTKLELELEAIGAGEENKFLVLLMGIFEPYVSSLPKLAMLGCLDLFKPRVGVLAVAKEADMEGFFLRTGGFKFCSNFNSKM